MDARITHIGTATVLLEIGGRRFITDPVLDAPRGAVAVGTGLVDRTLRSTLLAAPATAALEGRGVDVVLLSHHQHCDNLDAGGLTLCKSARSVVTTPAAAAWLRERDAPAHGLAPWSATTVDDITITAVPARHGPLGASLYVGACTGFVLEWPGHVLYISGDTVLFRGMHAIARRWRIDTALLHGGAAQFPGTIAAPLRFTMNAREMRRAIEILQPKRTLPIHVDGWSHFQEGRGAFTAALEGAPGDVVWLTPGAPRAL